MLNTTLHLQYLGQGPDLVVYYEAPSGKFVIIFSGRSKNFRVYWSLWVRWFLTGVVQP